MKNRNKGFTLIELVINLSLMSLVLLLVFKLININTVFTVDNNKQKDERADYVLTNLELYKDIQQTETITITQNQIILDDKTYSVENNTFYIDSEELFKIKSHEFIEEDGLITINIIIDQTYKPNEINLKIRRE